MVSRPAHFPNTGLERWLHARSISQLIIAGVSTNNSVDAAARTALANLDSEYATVVRTQRVIDTFKR